MAQWSHMVLWNLVNFDSGNSLLPDATKLWPQPMMTIWSIQTVQPFLVTIRYNNKVVVGGDPVVIHTTLVI